MVYDENLGRGTRVLLGMLPCGCSRPLSSPPSAPPIHDPALVVVVSQSDRIISAPPHPIAATTSVMAHMDGTLDDKAGRVNEGPPPDKVGVCVSAANVEESATPTTEWVVHSFGLPVDAGLLEVLHFPCRVGPNNDSLYVIESGSPPLLETRPLLGRQVWEGPRPLLLFFLRLPLPSSRSFSLLACLAIHQSKWRTSIKRLSVYEIMPENDNVSSTGTTWRSGR